jgi:hypothetical protein
MTSIEMRLAALESQVAELKTENELLKMLTPLEAITEGLKAATPAEVESWMAACEAVSGKMKTPKAKTPKDEKKNTNPTGPAEFNILIQAVWHEMAADAGVVGEHDDAFKKASKEVGVTFQKARAEASRRKAEMEGKPAPVPKVAAPKAAPKVTAPKVTAAKPAAPKAAAAAPKAAPALKAAALKAAPVEPTAEAIAAATGDYDDEMRAKMKAECEGYGWQARMFDEKACWLDPATGDCYSYDGIANVGVFDSESGEFCAA